MKGLESLWSEQKELKVKGLESLWSEQKVKKSEGRREASVYVCGASKK